MPIVTDNDKTGPALRITDHSIMLCATVIFILSACLASGEHFYVEEERTTVGFRGKTQQTVERLNVGSYQLLIVSKHVSWYEAKVVCESYNATLTTWIHPDFFGQVTKAVNAKGVVIGVAWLGARKIGKQFQWLNGKVVRPFRLEEDIVSAKQCLAVKEVEGSMKYVNRECDSRYNFICEKDLLVALQDAEAARPSPKITHEGREFVLYTVPLSFPAAAAFCAFKDKRLAVIDQWEIARKITKMMVVIRPMLKTVWTSGKYFDGGWNWLPTAEPIKHLNVSNQWIHISLQDVKLQDNCLYLQQNLRNNPRYLFTKCEKKMGVVCETVPRKKRSLRIKGRKVDYLVVHKRATWDQANQVCKNAGGSLAEAYDQDTLKSLITLIRKHGDGMTNVWLGAQSSGRSWVWKKSGKTVKPDESGLPFCACNKQPYHGIQCLTLERQKKDKPLLYGLPCNFEQGFICSNIDAEAP